MHHGRCFPALLRAYRQTQRRVNDKKNYSSSSSPSSLQIRRSIYSLSPSVNSGVRGMEYVSMTAEIGATKGTYTEQFLSDTTAPSTQSSRLLKSSAGEFSRYRQTQGSTNPEKRLLQSMFLRTGRNDNQAQVYTSFLPHQILVYCYPLINAPVRLCKRF